MAKSIVDVQRLISNLRPTQLDDLGLPAAIRWYLGEMGQHSEDLDIHFEQFGKSRELPSSVKIAIFRIVQEAITNVMRHSEAREARVNLHFQEKSVRVEVEDNGKGMDDDQFDFGRKESWGLLGIRERANLLGGAFDIQSKAGEGVRVSVLIPLGENTQGDE